MPPEPSFWPLPLGWWVILLGLLLMLLAPLGLWRQQHPDTPLVNPEPSPEADPLESLRRTALEELAQLGRPAPGEPASQWLQQINALLKRISRIRYPNANPHTLSGRAWLAFLDSRCPAAGLTRWMILVEGAYRAECHLDQKAIDGLLQAVSIWIQKHA